MRRFLRPIPLAVTGLTLLVVYTLAGFFLVPYIIKAHVLPSVSEQLHRPVTVKEVEFNPFVLSLKMVEFEIQDQDATPIIGFQEFFINFQTISLFHRAYVFDEIRFGVPYVSLKIAKDGHVNLLGLVPQKEADDTAANRSPSQEPAARAELPAVEIRHFEIAQGIVEFHDASKSNAVSIDVVPINLRLENFHTKPGGDNS